MRDKLKTNMLFSVAYQMLILLVPFITTPYVSRILLSEGVGTYSVTTAIAKYFWMFGLLGMANYGSREISKARDNRMQLSATFWGLFGFQVVTALLAASAYLVYMHIYGISQYNIVAICQLPYILSALFEVSWFFYGTEQFRFMVVRNGLIKILTMAAVFLLVNTADDVWIYTLINTSSLLLGQICLWPFLLKYVDWVRPSWKQIASHFKPNCILFVSVVAVSIYTQVSKILIEVFSTRAEVGYYESSEKLMVMANGIIGAIGSVMYPRISYLLGSGDRKSVHAYLAKSMKYVMIFAIAITFGLAGVAKEFSVVFFGNDFRRCGLLILAIAPAVLFYSWENILRTQYLLPGNRDAIFVQGTIWAALVNVLLNSWLIPDYGALGAVAGTVAAQFAAAAYQTLCVRKELPVGRYITNIILSILPAIAMFIFCRWVGTCLGETVISLIVQIFGGAVCFCILEGICLYVTKDEILTQVIRKCFRK